MYKREDIKKKIGLPPAGFKGLVTLRSKKAVFKHSSKSKRPMIVLDCEIVAPTEVKGVDGLQYEITGTGVTYFFMLDNQGKNGLDHLVDVVMPKLGLTPEIDIEQPNTQQFEDIYFEAMVSTDENIMTRRDPDNPDEFIPVKDSKGQDVVMGTKVNAFSNEIHGLCDAPEGVGTY